MMAKKKEFEALLALFDGAAGGICVTDREGTILYLNRAAEKMAEAEKAGVGRKETDLFGAPSVFEMCSGRNEAVTFPKDKNNGHSFLVLSYPLETQDGKGLIVSFLREKEETAEKDDENTLLIYKGNSMSQVFRLATKFAKMDSTVLISGESGTGKVMLAQYIHRNSSRRSGSFVSLNCAAMPGELLEEEFFGKTGKNGEMEKPGMLSLAAGGTLFLDEIDALPSFIQTRLLYALHERVYHPVGGRSGIPVDCRIITATNRDLHKMAEEGDFREDLFYLIGVFEVTIPPIRERTMDIMPMIRYLSERYNRRYGLHRRLTDGALEVLTEYSWPGNIREMDNTLERLIVMSPEDVIDVYHLPDHIRFQVVAETGPKKERGSLDEAVEKVERDIIRRAYEEYGSSYEVGRVLKISQSKANRLIRKYCVSGKEQKK